MAHDTGDEDFEAAIDAATKQADAAFAQSEAAGEWADWQGADPTTAPWWEAGAEWVWAVLETGGFLGKLTPETYRVEAKQVIQMLSPRFFEQELQPYHNRAFGPYAPDMKEAFATYVHVRLLPRLTARIVGPIVAKPVDVVPKEIEAVAQRRRAVVQPILRDKGWSNNDLATEAGVDHHTVNGYLDGRTKPYGSTLKKIADALGVSPDKLPE